MKNTMIKKATVLFALVNAIMTLTTGCNYVPQTLDLDSMIASKESVEVMNNDLSNTKDSVLIEEKVSPKTLATSEPKEESKLDSKAEVIKTKPEVKESKVEPLKTKVESKETKAEVEVKTKPAAKTEPKETEPINPAPVIQKELEVVVQEAPVSIPEDSYVEEEDETDSDSDSDADSSKPQEHTHTWVEEIIHHDEKTHEETVTETIHHDAVTESEYVPVIVCECGARFDDGKEFDEHECDTCQWSCLDWEKRTIEVSPAEDEEVTKTVTITDSPAWDEVITKCSDCGQYKD